YKKAVAHLQYVKQGESLICTGGLMNDADPSTFIPYFLTANHCFSTQAVASTLEAFFDFIAPTCSGVPPGLGSRPRTTGSTLLATNASTDFTLVRLPSIPAGRGLLGWTTELVPAGTVLYRLSHPGGFQLAFSATSVVTTGPTCGDVPRPRFIYSGGELGGTLGGSSGAPVVRADGRVVGQLLGACGPNADEGCDPSNRTVDGAFSQTFSSVAQFLNAAPPTPSVCTPGPSTLCLGSGGRFKVEATFDTGSQQGQAQMVKLTDETGYLWFFNSANVEAVVKVLNACGLNNNFWVFAGGLTNVQTQITVTDTKTGAAKTYTNPRGTPFQPIQDTSALATCP
ncbi:MAG TPA: trypsin-like peptidase domain-containing protein, partial [Thermoanaerobaculia bacterium]|nr:trypsin-like peptidase domain-containing protein [Thermoanaerobaculia bacterium]